MNITSSVILPPICSTFDKNLLSLPVPKFCDDSETLHDVFVYIKQNLEKKTNNSYERKLKFNKLQEKYLDTYDKILQKEKELKEKTGRANKGPFYYFDGVDKYGRKIFTRLRQRQMHREGIEFKCRKNNDVQEV